MIHQYGADRVNGMSPMKSYIKAGIRPSLEADSGEAGLIAAEQYKSTIELVITDIIMPGISGRELVKQLVLARPGIKVLYLSGYTEDAIVSEGSLEPGTAFLQKPFSLQILSRKVREVLG